jgi:hypothetical protein
VIIHDLDVVRISVAPDETDPELVVDANAVLPLPIAPERLQPVSRKNGQVPKLLCGVQQPEFALRNPRDPLETTSQVSREQRLGVASFERPNHKIVSISRMALYVKQDSRRCRG